MHGILTARILDFELSGLRGGNGYTAEPQAATDERLIAVGASA